MTERLTQRMHDEADRLDVPFPDAAAVLARGRRVRGRRRQAAAGSVVAAAVLVGAVVAITGLLGDGPAPEPAPSGPADLGVVYSVENTVYLRGGAVTAEIDEGLVKSLRYTSAGVLVERGDDRSATPTRRPASPQRFSVVRPDGSVEDLDLELAGTPFGTDLTQPLVAYTVEADGGLDVVVTDLDDGSEVARVPLPPQAVSSEQRRPDVDLDGDTVWVGGPTPLAVTWSTGEVEAARFVGLRPEVNGGLTVIGGRGLGRDTTIVDSTGRIVLSRRDAGDASGSFSSANISPDGSTALLYLAQDDSQRPMTVVDLDTGRRTRLVDPRASGAAFAWSADNDLFRVSSPGSITVCSSATGECTHEWRGGLSAEDVLTIRLADHDM